MPRRVLISIVFLLTALAGAKVAIPEASPKPSEYDVKAAYIYNFAKFTEWPPGAFQDGERNIHLCVIGDDPFGHSLAAIERKSVGGRRIRVRRGLSVRNLHGCEMVFISASEKEGLEQILETLHALPILTIGDTRGFAQRGVMINFFMEKRKVLFEINPRAADHAGLKISSTLLRIARITGSKRD